MASIRMFKGGLYPFPASQSRIGRFGCSGRRIAKSISVNRMLSVSCRIQNNGNNGEEPIESLFMKELKRRGISPTSLLDESWITSNNEDITFKEEYGKILDRNNVSIHLEENLSNQRERYREGLQRLIPRANLLIRLGGTLFLAFWPLILVTVAFFSAIDLYLGPQFGHDSTAKQIQRPENINPYTLVEDERKRISESSTRLIN